MAGNFIGVRWGRDRTGLHIACWLTWRFLFCMVFHPSMWAGSLYCFRRALWVRPINYSAIEQARQG